MAMEEGRVPIVELPKDIIFSILKRLPAKSLMRFKCASKSWEALIYDPHFAQSHLNHARTRPGASYLLFYIGIGAHPPHSIVPANLEAVITSQLPKITFHDCFPCTNVAKGLILLFNRVSSQLNLLNLTTGEKVALPTPEEQKWSHLHNRNSNFLGFDSTNKKYKVLHFNMDEESWEILTLGTRLWRKIDSSPKMENVGKPYCGADAIFWREKSVKGKKEITHTFDFQDEKFHLLDYQEGERGIGVILVEYGLCLAALEVKDQSWVKDGIRLVSDNWIRDPTIVGRIRTTGEILVTARAKYDDSLKLFLYDLGTKEFRTIDISWPDRPEMVSGLVSSVATVAKCNHVENILPLRSLVED